MTHFELWTEKGMYLKGGKRSGKIFLICGQNLFFKSKKAILKSTSNIFTKYQSLFVFDTKEKKEKQDKRAQTLSNKKLEICNEDLLCSRSSLQVRQPYRLVFKPKNRALSGTIHKLSDPILAT